MKEKLISVAKSVGVVALGAFLVGVSAYATGHEAENPALYGAIVVAIVEVRSVLKARGVVLPTQTRA